MSRPPDPHSSRRHVYLLRHGRTPLNADPKLRGRTDTPLDSIGRLEAAALGELFATVPLAAIVASWPGGRTLAGGGRLTVFVCAMGRALTTGRERGLIEDSTPPPGAPDGRPQPATSIARPTSPSATARALTTC